MIIALTAIWSYLKNSKALRIIIGVITLLVLIGGFTLHEFHNIKSKQKLVDELNQQKQLTLAIQAQEVKDKAIIDTFNSTVGINTAKVEKQKETVKQIIKDNPIWANTLVPNGVNEEVNQ